MQAPVSASETVGGPAADEDAAVATETAVECPFCAHTAQERTAMHRHLMVEHRKSTLSKRLIELAVRSA
jgi:hypothetical protein